jgi:Polyketide cyclase / dehydrase and lipid transport
MLRFENKRIAICRHLAAPPETVWDILTDTTLWSIWGPSVFAVDCQDRHIRLGSKGRVQIVFSLWLPFTVSEFRDLDCWSWRIGSYPATGHTLKSRDDRSSTLCFDMPWWAAVYLPLCWLALIRIGKIASRC